MERAPRARYFEAPRIGSPPRPVSASFARPSRSRSGPRSPGFIRSSIRAGSTPSTDDRMASSGLTRATSAKRSSSVSRARSCFCSPAAACAFARGPCLDRHWLDAHCRARPAGRPAQADFPGARRCGDHVVSRARPPAEARARSAGRPRARSAAAVSAGQSRAHLSGLANSGSPVPATPSPLRSSRATSSFSARAPTLNAATQGSFMWGRRYLGGAFSFVRSLVSSGRPSTPTPPRSCTSRASITSRRTRSSSISGARWAGRARSVRLPAASSTCGWNSDGDTCSPYLRSGGASAGSTARRCRSAASGWRCTRSWRRSRSTSSCKAWRLLATECCSSAS